MGIVSFSFWLSKILSLFLVLALAGCGQVQKRKKVKPSVQPSKVEIVYEEENSPEKVKPRVGIVLGGGGLKTYAHVGVLQAFEKARIPIHSIIGLEWGALVAGLYAAKGRANDLEWQFFKLAEPDFQQKSFLGGSGQRPSVRKMESYLKKTLGDVQFDDLNLDMSCPSWDLTKNRVSWKDSGKLSEALKKCMAYPPFFRGGQEVAAPFALREAAVKLNQRGANVVIFVNVLKNGRLFINPLESENFRDVLLWQRIQKAYDKETSDFDEVLGLYLKDVGLKDFSKRRSLLKKGRRSGEELTEKLAEKYGL